MKLRYLPLALLAFSPLSSQADTAGIRIGGGSWDHDPSGTVRYQSTLATNDADLDNDLNLQEKKEGYVFVVVEHPVPLLPNLRVMSTALQNTGTGTVSSTFTYGGQTFSATNSVTSDLTLDHTDFTLYWQLLDNVVSLDLGLNLKAVDATARLTNNTTSTTVTNSFDGIIPMGYIAVGVSPIEGLEIRAEVSSLSVGNSSITDSVAKIMYTSEYLFGIEAGVRSIELELDDLDQVYSNMKFDGPFVGAYLHF